MSARLALLASSVALAACCGPQVQALKNDPRGKLDECTHFVVLATVLEDPSSAAGIGAASTASTATTATQNPPGADPTTGIVPDVLAMSPWVYCTPWWPGVISPEVEDAWRPPTTREGRVADVDENPENGEDPRPSVSRRTALELPAPASIRVALHAARAALERRGLRPLERPARPGERVLVLGVSLSTRDVTPRLREVGDLAEPQPARLRLARVAVHAGSVLDGKFVRDLTSLAAVYPEECAPQEPFDDEVAGMVTKLVRGLPD